MTLNSLSRSVMEEKGWDVKLVELRVTYSQQVSCKDLETKLSPSPQNSILRHGNSGKPSFRYRCGVVCPLGLVWNILPLDRRLFVLYEHRYSAHDTAMSRCLVVQGNRYTRLKHEKSSGQHVPITIPSKWLSCCFCYTNNEE
jgi:hypothetical protein